MTDEEVTMSDKSSQLREWLDDGDSMEAKDRGMNREDIPAVDMAGWETMRGGAVYVSGMDSPPFGKFDFWEEDWDDL